MSDVPTTGELPPGLDPTKTDGRKIHLEASAETQGGTMLKIGRVGKFTVQCDEGPQVGGGATAPSPLMYLLLALGF